VFLQKTILAVLLVTIGVICVPAQNTDKGTDRVSSEKTGILVLAHGGKQNWNDEVAKLVSVVNERMPAEVAFGMASKRNMQQAVDRLIARGATEIVAVPLFISSHSSVITSTEFLLGLRKKAPPEVAVFAKMDHGGDGHSGHGSHVPAENSIDPPTPVLSRVPIRMLPALNDHHVVADILLTRASGISRRPENEVVIVVAHGPVSDADNNRWLADMGRLAERIRAKSGFKRIEFLTVRDDAPAEVRDRASAELRSVVERANGEKAVALVVPLLLSYGGIEDGIKKRLEGLEYTMSKHGLLPDDRLARWVLSSAEKR
jgi:sirohydrochlorin ferrochelatase